ncbi:MAG: MFS transporter [Pseudomonadota bacterium]
MRVLSAIWIARVPCLAFVVIGLFWGSFAASVPDLKARLGVGDAVFGLLLVANGVGLVAAMWAAPVLDRWLSARSLQAVVACFACAIALPAFASTPGIFLASMVCVGFFSGLSDILMNARVSELEASHARPLMNSAHGMFSVAYAVAALYTGFFRDAAQPPEVTLLFTATLCLLIATRLYAPIGTAEDDSVAGELPPTFPWRIVLMSGAIVLVAFMSEATVETWSALHIERTLGGDPLAGAIGPLMLGLTMAVGRFSGQAVSERFADHQVIIAASLLSASGAVIAALAPSPAWAYLGFGTFGLGVSVIGPLGIALAGRLVRPRFRTEAISKTAVMGFSGFFIAPVFMGGVSEVAGLRVAYLGVACLVLMAIVLVISLRRITA